jgi:predicted phage terminase large subunit-like protein
MTTASAFHLGEQIERAKAMSPAFRAEVIRATTPRLVDEYMLHIPHPVQQAFLTLRHREVLFGGAAGGGKSDALLMAALQYVDVPGYSALLLRRTWQDLVKPNAIMDRTRQWLESTNAVPRDGGREWRFPSGARITFGYLQYDKDKYQYQSAEYQFIGFDELTQFEQGPYEYLFSRLRRPALPCMVCKTPLRRRNPKGPKNAPGKRWYHVNEVACTNAIPDPKVLHQYGPAKQDGITLMDVPLRMRSATNPGGIGHVWVRDHFINKDTKSDKALFIPSLLRDNPALDRTEYEESLSHLTAVDRERLLNGDWDVIEEGAMFQRHWFKHADDFPRKAKVVRYWDLASVEGGGDWTVGALVSLTEDGQWFIEDIVRGQWSPLQVERVIKQTALQDGRNIPVRMEQEPGSSGVNTIDHYRRNVLIGFDFDGDRPTGGKSERARPLASAAEAGNVYIVKGQWHPVFLDEISLFPNVPHDDQVDAVSGAVGFLAFGKRGRLLV